MAAFPSGSAGLAPLPPCPAVLSTYVTAEGHGQAARFSPFDGNRIAVVTGTNFGLSGQGFLHVLERKENGTMERLWVMDYRDNMLDVAWSETDGNVLATSAGDGFIQVWNVGGKFPRVPVHEFKGHRKEMSSLDWNLPKFSNNLLAASWDGTVSVYDMTSPWPVLKIPVSELMVYQAQWSPHSGNIFISASSDGILQLWDLNANQQKAQVFLSCSETELLCCDWAKYSDSVIVTAGADSIIRGWDMRQTSMPIFLLEDHGHAVRRVKFSPWHPTTVASVSYDMTIRIWDIHASDCALEIVNAHSEVIYGLDWSLKMRNELVTCAWDKMVHVSVPMCLRQGM